MNTQIPPAPVSELEDIRTGSSVEALKRAYLDNLFYIQGKYCDVATPHDLYMAAAYSVRDRVLARWIKTARSYKSSGARTVCYLSAEFLVGPHLANNLVNLGLVDAAEKAAEELGLDYREIIDQEEEPGLGNGGLGRLAACYMDSLATLQIPSIGYGIRYEFGIFDQEIHDGWQQEISDLWLRNGNPWELPRPKLRFPVRFGGHSEHYTDNQGRLRVNWVPELVVKSSGRVVFLKVDDVDWVDAAGNYVKIHAGKETHQLRETMSRLEQRLDPEKFLRIHRSTIVNIERIRELQQQFHGDYLVVLKNGQRLTLSRSYRDRIQQLLDRSL